MNMSLVVMNALIFCPIFIFVITYSLISKRKNSSTSFGIAADITTFLLFLSVALIISSIWGVKYSSIVLDVALLIAIIYTFIDWKSSKEIQLIPLFKKIWRTSFLFLSVAYISVLVFMLTQQIVLTVAN